jgi:hypothetical protein
MTEWVLGTMFVYHDPDGDYIDDERNYIEVEGDKSGTIAMVEFSYDEENRPPAAIAFVSTDDAAQAERWRSLFAAGRYPDLKADPRPWPASVSACGSHRPASLASSVGAARSSREWIGRPLMHTAKPGAERSSEP